MPFRSGLPQEHCYCNGQIVMDRKMSDDTAEKNTIRQLTRLQRRVLGTLMEKGFTTPDQYPMTLKGCTTGCNQKSNRDPITEYSEAEVADALEQLRQLGLVAEVFTDGGRAARYRHYARHKYDFNEAQFAILCELLLRGRQQPGELRTRASRMVRIDSQDQLKADLQSLFDKGFIQSSGAMDRRGVEVDHTFYLPKENMKIAAASLPDEPNATPESMGTSATPGSSPRTVTSNTATASPATPSDVGLLRALQDKLNELNSQVSTLQSAMDSIQQRLDRMERDLGV
ncbi:MAG: YceH family protein [Planctomycetota bacterium]